MKHISRVRTTLIGTALLLSVTSVFAKPEDKQEQGTAQRAHEVLTKSCALNDCHGGASPIKFDAAKQASLLSTGVVKPKDAEHSELLKRVNSNNMPPGQPLPEAAKKALNEWIVAGAPNWETVASSVRKPVSEKDLLQAIARDLAAANPGDRPFLRYYSLVNLHNNPEVDDKTLDMYRSSLSKLVNHLSWRQKIVVPKTLGPDKTLMRIDFRDYKWTPATWLRIVVAYPYGVRDFAKQCDQIKALCGAELPYVRVDWFVANASIAPLYHDILELPDNLPDLERKLGVDVAGDVANEKCLRAGLRNSGVSRNNRAVQRLETLFGAFWMSFDFGGNKGAQNIFLNPLNFRENGGEFIFNLPNGLQGYMIANADGKRLDEAPISIVRDRITGGDTTAVRNGRSCIACHSNGMKTFHDEVRPVLLTQQKADFDLTHALNIYKAQPELDRAFEDDVIRFRNAAQATGSPLSANPKEELLPTDEPINKLSNQYEGSMSTTQAAAEVGLTRKEFLLRIGHSTELEKLGFGQLQGEKGGIKRDLWEENFGTLVEEIRLGEYVKPAEFRKHSDVARAADLPTLRIGDFRGEQHVTQKVRQQLFIWLNQSAELRLTTGRADHALRGEISARGDLLTIALIEEKSGVREEAIGAETEIAFLTQQLANRIHLRITGEPLPVRAAANIARPVIAAASAPIGVPVDVGVALAQTVKGQGAGGIALTVDRGPGSLYKFGEEVQVRVKVDRDCCLTLYNIDSQGNVNLLFPNQFTQDNHVKAGELILLADPKDGWKIEVSGVPGLETVIAVATPEPINLPGLADFRRDPKSKSLGAVKREGNDRNLRPSELAQAVQQKIGNGGALSTATVRFTTVR